AEDLEASRDGKPIKARPSGLWERSAKWVRRRPVIAALTGALVVTIVAGLGGIGWQFYERGKALRQRERMGRFLKGVFRGLANATDSAKRDRILDAAAERLDTDLKEPPELQADVRVALGAMYYSFGDFQKAEAMYRPAL